jgi:MtfA peptidase
VKLCDDAYDGLPATLDPDSDAAAPFLRHLPLDPYAAQDPAEFFAVCAEVLFTDPVLLEKSFPVFYHNLRGFFKS